MGSRSRRDSSATTGSIMAARERAHMKINICIERECVRACEWGEPCSMREHGPGDGVNFALRLRGHHRLYRGAGRVHVSACVGV
eukprot:363756-Chlamydomonas_euryale.AAC.9